MIEHRSLETSPLPVRLRIEDYLLLDQNGAFDRYAKTELIDGEIVSMNAQHRPHALAKMELYDALRDKLRSIGSNLRPLVEASVAVPPDSAPDPDIVLTSEPNGEGLIPIASVRLLIEISDTTLAFDLRRKPGLYAAAGIPEYWVADIRARMIHQMWSPADGAYTEQREIAFGQRLVATTIDGLTIETIAL